MDLSKSNFAAQCAGSLTRQKTDFDDSAAHVMEMQARRLRSAIHFKLPSGGLILDDGLRGLTGLDNLRLPFRTITAEFSIENSKYGPTPVVVLAEESNPNEAGVVDISVDVFYDVEGRGWLTSVYSFKLRSDGWDQNKETGTWFSDFYLKSLSDKERSAMGAGLNLGWESILELCEALTCTNVSHDIEQRAWSAEKNEKRRKRGKFPVWEYRVLTVNTSKNRMPGEFQGTHATPRQHLRRGHIRRLSSGKNTWVQQCVVGKAARGIIEKSYEVRV